MSDLGGRTRKEKKKHKYFIKLGIINIYVYPIYTYIFETNNQWHPELLSGINIQITIQNMLSLSFFILIIKVSDNNIPQK